MGSKNGWRKSFGIKYYFSVILQYYIITTIDKWEEVLHLSVNATRRPTLSAEDVDACHITSKSIPALLADILLPDLENVHLSSFRRMVPQNPRPQGNRKRKNALSQKNPPHLQKPNQRPQLICIFGHLNIQK